MKTIIIKIGTKILTNESNQLDLNNLRRLTAEISDLIHNHHLNCIIVSSGAIVSGSETLLLSPTTIPEKQAAASVGQILLLKEYPSPALMRNSISTVLLVLTLVIY